MYVPIDQAVTFAKSLVKTANNADTNVWKEWIYYGALIHLGVSDDEIDVTWLTPKDGIAALPEHCRHVLQVSLFDSAGNQLKHKYRSGKQRIYSDQRLMTTTVGSNENINNNVPVDISNDAYNFILGTNADMVASIYVRYYKYPLDEKGRPLIREEDLFACAMFVKFMQAVRDNANRSEIAQYDQLWKQAADKAKADKRTESVTPEIMQTIGRDWMRLIPNFNMRTY